MGARLPIWKLAWRAVVSVVVLAAVVQGTWHGRDESSAVRTDEPVRLPGVNNGAVIRSTFVEADTLAGGDRQVPLSAGRRRAPPRRDRGPAAPLRPPAVAAPGDRGGARATAPASGAVCRARGCARRSPRWRRRTGRRRRATRSPWTVLDRRDPGVREHGPAAPPTAREVPQVALMRFWAPALPISRVVWLRIVYAFVIWSTPPSRRRPDPHGDVPVALYRPLIVRQLLQPAAAEPRLRPRAVRRAAGERGRRVHRTAAAPGRMRRCALAMLDWMSNGMSYCQDRPRPLRLHAGAVRPADRRAARGTRPSLDEGAGWAIRLIQMGAVASYFLAFWAKMRFGGWGWANGATLVIGHCTRRPHGIAPWLGQQPLLTHTMQWVVLVFEACSPVMLWLRGRPLYAYVLFWLAFHASTYYLLAISSCRW